MKKYLLAMGLIIALGFNATTAAQTRQIKEQQELVDTTAKDNLEAFSDTISIADSLEQVIDNTPADWDDDDDNTIIDLKQIFKGVNGNGLAGMLFALMVIMIIFVFSPLIIFGLLLYFIFRNRRQKMKLAQMAVQNGQPIPDQLLNDVSPNDSETYKSGMRQLFLGLGLMIFLGITVGEIGFGIGALVLFIGLGKVIIARKSMAQENLNRNLNQNNNQNSNNIQNYE